MVKNSAAEKDCMGAEINPTLKDSETPESSTQLIMTAMVNLLATGTRSELESLARFATERAEDSAGMKHTEWNWLKNTFVNAYRLKR